MLLNEKKAKFMAFHGAKTNCEVKLKLNVVDTGSNY